MKRISVNNMSECCGDMLAYLYNEMSPADREVFETHLADCGSCIDDFAELSQSRYPVYEWKRVAFDALPTPRFSIPYEARSTASWIESIRLALKFRPTLSLGVAAAALMAAVFTGFVLFNTSAENQELAQEIEPAASPVRVGPSVMPTSDATAEMLPEEPVPSVALKAVQSSATAKPPARPMKPKASQTKKRNESIPVLSTVEDEEDDSLRLTDVFDEIGTSE